MKSKLTINLVKSALRSEVSSVEKMKSGDQKDNPQVVSMILKAEGRIEAFEAVLDAMRGSLGLMYIISKYNFVKKQKL